MQRTDDCVAHSQLIHLQCNSCILGLGSSVKRDRKIFINQRGRKFAVRLLTPRHVREATLMKSFQHEQDLNKGGINRNANMEGRNTPSFYCLEFMQASLISNLLCGGRRREITGPPASISYILEV